MNEPMRSGAVFVVLICIVGVARAQFHNWIETRYETIWRKRYTNCDKGYAVDLPSGVIAHDSLPPNPNHGFLISAAAPNTTAAVALDSARIIDVFDEYNSMDFATPREFLNSELAEIAKKEILHVRPLVFRGLRAIEGHYRTLTDKPSEVDELVVFRQGIVYVLMLRTTPQNYRSDCALFAQIKAGFRTLALPMGACSNP